MLVVQGLINSVCAAIFGLSAGQLDRWIGSKAAVTIYVLGALLANITLCTITPDSLYFMDISALGDGSIFPRLADKAFVVVSALAAACVTGGFAASRTMMARLSPPNMLADFFSLYALSGTATSFVGPLAIGILTSIFGNQRAGVAVGVVFFIVGLIVLVKVREPATDSRS